MNLTSHFTLEELTDSDLAERKGIDNTPSSEIVSNLYVLADGLERARTVLGEPITITSGYRSPKLNSSLGGAKNSQHTQGLAADFKVQNMTPREVCFVLMENEDFVRFDQLIQEGKWTHISFSDNPRGEVLTAHFGSMGTTYTKGLA